MDMTPWAGLMVGDIVEKDYRAAVVFEHHGIDYCRGRQLPLEAACAEVSADLAEVEAELIRLGEEAVATLPATTWDLDEVVGYVIDRHHRYVRDTLPILRAWCRKLVARHGAEHPELGDIAGLVEELDGELSPHLVKEEQILFPWIVRMAEARRGGQPIGASPFGTVLHPIRVMESEHERADEIVGMLRALTGNFTPPEDACLTWRICWAELDRFDRDLRNHVHLENHLLFPRALDLERLLG
jgi:regulator of cell morphogenesis and NO signaling